MSSFQIWGSMFALGFIILGFRASFIIFWGEREMPPWLHRHLRYVAVAIIPGMIAQLVAFPTNPAASSLHWTIAALTSLAVGVWRKSALWAMLAGAGAYVILLASPWF